MWVVLAALAGCTFLTQDDLDLRLDPDSDGVRFPFDCDDSDPDLGPTVELWPDDDGDGRGDAARGEERCPKDGWVTNDLDCDDTDPARSSDLDDPCHGIDDDCDGLVDDEATGWYATFPDADGDGFGVTNGVKYVCTPLPGYTDSPDDCDDTDATVFPGATEVCDAADNDCDGLLDEGLLFLASVDGDGDGYGDPADARERCELPAGWVADTTDCDDGDANVYPGAPEDCTNGVDEGCRGYDENDTAYTDADGDTFGADGSGHPGCPADANDVFVDGDCDDTDRFRNPARTEDCTDDVDEDCDGITELQQFYADADRDGAGDATAPTMSCGGSATLADNAADCDDTDPDEPLWVSPDGSETGDGTEASPFSTLADALDEDPACVAMRPGEYSVTAHIRADVSIAGTSTADEVVLVAVGFDCATTWGGCSPLFEVDSALLTLTDVTLTGGNGSPSSTATSDGIHRFVCGGLIEATDSVVFIQDSVLEAGTLPAATTFESGGTNYVLDSGGGAICMDGGSLWLTDVLIHGGSATYGGALYLQDAELDIKRAAFAENDADYGGAVWADTSQLQAGQLRGWCNTATYDGGSFWLGGATDASLRYVDLVDDVAATGGSAVWAEDDVFVLLDSAVVQSDAPSGTAAVDGTGLVRVSWSVGAEAGGDAFGSVSERGDVVTTTADVHTITCDGDPSNDTFVLATGSPAIDAGDEGEIDVDGTRADAGANGGPGGAW